MDKKQQAKQILKEIENMISDRKKTIDEYGKRFPMNVSSESDRGTKEAMLKKMKDLGLEIESKKKQAEKLIKDVKQEEKTTKKNKNDSLNAAKSGADALYIK